MINKKAQGMSMNLIVVAAIALLVLIIVVAIFGSRMGKFAKNSDDCAAQGGSCEDGDADKRCTQDGYVKIPAKCSDEQICCYNLEAGS
jgi:FtsZ-interacting cell division protein ZipA